MSKMQFGFIWAPVGGRIRLFSRMLHFLIVKVFLFFFNFPEVEFLKGSIQSSPTLDGTFETSCTGFVLSPRPEQCRNLLYTPRVNIECSV